MTDLLDSSLLIGIAVDDHLHHDVAAAWLASHSEGIATCPITEGALVRHVVRNGRPATEAVAFLTALAARRGSEFWPDELPYSAVPLSPIIGHRQVTDAYLAQLARQRGARLVTLDKGLAALHPDVAVLVPVEKGGQ